MAELKFFFIFNSLKLEIYLLKKEIFFLFLIFLAEELGIFLEYYHLV